MGTSTCLTCHADKATQKTHAHRLGFRKPGVTSGLQDLSLHPGFDDGLAYFKDATSSNFKTNGTSLWYYDYDSTRGFDKFKISTSSVAGAEVRVYLWKDTADSKYKITMENLVNSEADRTFEVALTYGGAVHKQRYMLAIPDSSYKGRYPFLQYQHEGDNFNYDRTRKVWRDYHMDQFWNASTKMFKYPDKKKNIESNCMACHVTGYRYFTDSSTGERLCDGVNDSNGAFDIDGDGNADEVNTGCEVCHGPGSEHVSANKAQSIVVPDCLSPSRENMLCGRCHNRVEGNDDLKNDQPLNAAGEMPPPGISRKDFLANYTSRKGPALKSMWPDTNYSKSHHQQYNDLVKSKHYRNDERLVTCSNCHEPHGGTTSGVRDLKSDPRDGTLCSQCHVIDITKHQEEYTGSKMSAQFAQCTDCHYYKIAKSGAGTMGLLLGTPTGASSDENLVYWKNDISSHLTMVPGKFNKGVAGVTPGKAMPVPYVNRCGTCHDASKLKYFKQ